MAAYKVPRHVWRTVDGRLVVDGHPEAAVLAYATGDELAEAEARRLGVLAVLDGDQHEVEPDEPDEAAASEKVRRGRARG